MKSLLSKLAALMAAGLLAVSCATTSSNVTDAAVDMDDFEGGIAIITRGQEAKKPRYPANNAVSLFLDRGMLNHYAGNYAQSSKDLEEAERLIEEAYTKSVTAEIASYIANDNSKDYAGEDFEDIYINVFNALNYYKQGNVDEAMVEIRKLVLSSGKLDMLARKYENTGRSAGDWVLQQLGNIGFNLNVSLPQGEPMTYSASALGQYLSALFFLANGNRDNARVAFNAVGQAYASNPNIYTSPVPRAVRDAQNVPAGKARLNIVAFAGLSPVKEEEKFEQKWPFMQNPELQTPIFKLPVFKDRDSGEHQITITVNGETFELELIEDMGAVAKETYKAKFANLFFKTYLRVMLKYAAADLAATKAAEAGGSFAGIARLAAANVAKIALDATEGADIRMGRYLPNKAYVGGINLDPGSYTVTITYESGYEKEMVVEVKAGDINLIDAVSLTGKPGRRSGPGVVQQAPSVAQSPQQPQQQQPATGGQEVAQQVQQQLPQQQQPVESAQNIAASYPAGASASSGDYADAWKEKWVYIGGGYGFGVFSRTVGWYDIDVDHYYKNTYYDSLYGGEIVLDLALTRFFSIEADVLFPYNGADRSPRKWKPMFPMMGKVGGRFGQFEASGNVGYAVDGGFIFGGTLGVHAGPGVVYTQAFVIPTDAGSPFLMFIGYKAGMGDKN